MFFLDTRSVLLGYVISNAISLGIIFSLWRKHRHHSRAFDFWLGGFVLQFVSMLMFSLRGALPDAIAILLGVPTTLIGLLLLYRGLCEYFGQRFPQRRNLLLVAALIVIHVYFLWQQPSLQLRSINFTIGLLLLFGQMAWLLLRRVEQPLRDSTSVLAWILVAYCIVSLGRIAIDLLTPLHDDFFAPGQYLALLFLIYQMLGIGKTFALLLLVNNRLLGELEEDIAARKQVEHELQALNAVLQNQATTDQLTQIANRRQLTRVLDHEAQRLKRYGTPVAVIMMDVDHFKSINDRFSHQAGDDVLIGIAKVLASNVRIVDTPGRWGGEEFLIVCPETDAAGAGQLAELLRKQIEATDFALEMTVTASFGVAAAHTGTSVEDLLKDADAALYRAKASKRNCVVVAPL